MQVGYAFLSQGQRPTSNQRARARDDWLRQVRLAEFDRESVTRDDLPQVEINTHVGPHRRLWMGPQFQFKHYTEATVSVCHPNSNVCTADAPQTSMSVIDADLETLE